MRKNYRLQKTISVKHFISELGENFSEHIKERLLDLEIRSVLTRKDYKHILDIKHVEHTKYDCSKNPEEEKNTGKKEYSFGRFLVIDEELYFAESSLQDDAVMQSPVVNKIYNSLNTEPILSEEEINCKKIDDSNIDYVLDSLLEACPDVSEQYVTIMKDVLFRAEEKFENTTRRKKAYY